MTDFSHQSNMDLLETVRHKLVCCNNCTATDRPDLAQVPEDLSWVIDNSKAIKSLEMHQEKLSALLASLEAIAANAPEELDTDYEGWDNHDDIFSLGSDFGSGCCAQAIKNILTRYKETK